MANIHYLEGDATQPIGNGVKIVAHVCNNIGAWGAGFVLAVSKRWPIAKSCYLRIKNKELGLMQLVHVGNEVFVANMIAQNNINDSKSGWLGDLIDYDALVICLDSVFSYAQDIGATVHMPRIGCGLAGSSWDKIEPLLIHVVQRYNVECYVYTFENAKYRANI